MTDKAPKIYNYHGVTGEYLGESTADADPLETGNWLIPGNACLDAPPAAKKGHAVCRADSGWHQVEDNRGLIYSTESGHPFTLEELGLIPEGYTAKERPSPSHAWNGASWRLSKEAEHASLVRDAQAKRSSLLAAAAVRIGPLQDAIDLDDSSDAERELLTALKRYRVALNRIELQEGFPKNIAWPQMPE